MNISFDRYNLRTCTVDIRGRTHASYTHVLWKVCSTVYCVMVIIPANERCTEHNIVRRRVLRSSARSKLLNFTNLDRRDLYNLDGSLTMVNHNQSKQSNIFESQ